MLVTHKRVYGWLLTHTSNVAPCSILFSGFFDLCFIVRILSKSCSEIYSGIRFTAKS
jgi:hypothetical protein